MATSASAAAAVSEGPGQLEQSAGTSTGVIVAAAFLADRDGSFNSSKSYGPPAAGTAGQDETPVPVKYCLPVEDPLQNSFYAGHCVPVRRVG